MFTRLVLILAGLVVAGLVGAFMLYVSVLSLITAITIILGGLAMLFLGYWAGSHSPDQPPSSAKISSSVPAKNASADVVFVPDLAGVANRAP
jgi:hypothetical protein